MKTTTTRYVVVNARDRITATFGDQRDAGVLGFDTAAEAAASITGHDPRRYRVRLATGAEIREAARA